MKQRDKYTFYRDRSEWLDITPVPQDEEGRNIVKIAYSSQFLDANDYLRAVLCKDERSKRTLELTATVLILNPANYTAWEYRRRILLSLGSDLNEELNFVGKLIDEHAKNYQIWHHRQWILTTLLDNPGASNTSEYKHTDLNHLGLEELEFLKEVIADDSKNYHAWQHRRWVVNYFKISPSVEQEYTESLLEEDMYNNSAWNHRFVTVTKDEGLTPNVLQREVDFVQRIIRKSPNNESAWNYLYGLLVPAPCVVAAYKKSSVHSSRPDLASFNTNVDLVDETHEPESHLSKHLTELVIRAPSAANLRMMRTFAEELADSDAVAADSVALQGFLVEVYSDCIQAATSAPTSVAVPQAEALSNDICDDRETDESLSQLIDLAVATCERLATVLDRIRANYWRYRARQLQSMVYQNKA